MIELEDHLARCLGPADPFDAVLRLDGPVYREHKHRRTFRVELEDRPYFVKIHGNTSWTELLKNALRGRWPVLTARNERDAIRRLEALDVLTIAIAGYGCRGRAPAGLESFIITHALEDTRQMDHLVKDWRALPRRQRQRLRRRVVEEIARIARRMHGDGMSHRDFYLCHFLVHDRDWATCDANKPLGIHVIDLHRAELRAIAPARAILKDLAGLLFSAFDADLSTPEVLRFLEIYEGRPWREGLRGRPFLARIARRAIRLYRSEHGTRPPLPAVLASFA